MLQNWLKPVSAATRKQIEQLPPDAFGKNIALNAQKFPDLKKVRIALIGAGEAEADAVRAELYRSCYTFPKGAVADLGNLQRAEASMLIPVLFELLSGKVLPVVLARDPALARAPFLAYQEAKALVNLAVVDETLRLDEGDSSATYGPLLKPRHRLLFHFGLIGFQTHQTPPDVVDFLQKNNFDALRLGKTRPAIEETEPVLRDADLLNFHLGALKQCEAPGVDQPSPSGYFTEEACQLCRYAGMSDKLTAFGIFGYRHENDLNRQTAQTVSQMLWYFFEGFFNRKNDYPASKDGLTEYIVDFRNLQHQLTFWKSTRSGRWWMQAPVTTKKKHQRHYLIPCSYQDYQAACREELPDRLLQALGRFA